MAQDLNKLVDIVSIKDGNNRYRLCVDGITYGWITKWHKSSYVNKTGIKMFSAKPIGLSTPKHDCDTYDQAKAYILGYFNK